VATPTTIQEISTGQHDDKQKGKQAQAHAFSSRGGEGSLGVVAVPSIKDKTSGY
jgi:hypothetical protein